MDTGEEGEETLFHVQGKLFCFDGTNWVERGLGTFKLNKAQSVSEEHGDGSRATARFIMRAQQTHRVVLNTPVFKQMSIGDTKGNEPSGKTISFAAVENGKPVPYLLRVSRPSRSYQSKSNHFFRSWVRKTMSSRCIEKSDNCKRYYDYRAP